MTYEYIFRGILIGNPNVGKTSLCQQYLNDKCPTEHESTIGVDFFSKIVDVKYSDEKTHAIKLQLWDTAGTDSFKSITRSYYRNTALVFIVYDCTNRRSFKDVIEWLKDVKSVCDPNIVITLIHNKSDLHLRSQVDPHEAKAFAEERGMLFGETSSKMGIGVDSCFYQSVRELHKKLKLGIIAPESRLGIRSTELDGGLNISNFNSNSNPTTTNQTTRLCNHCNIL